jgi:hypothetical protein
MERIIGYHTNRKAKKMANDTTEVGGESLAEVFQKFPSAGEIAMDSQWTGKKVKYIYSMEDCPKCDKRKEQLRNAHITFTERSGDRLSMDTRIMDNIDKEAHLQLQMQNLTFPVEIDIIPDYE